MKKIFAFCLLLLALQPVWAQRPPVARQLTLDQVIALALQESVWAKQAIANKENNYWQFRTYKAGYKPQLALNGTLPDFSRTISPVIQPDGTTAFRQVAINNAALNLSLSQGIGLTGGEFFVQSQVQRFDDFDRNQKSYNTNPAIIGISQPLFGYNALAWNKKIEPLRYEESLKKYVEDREVISLTATERFFDLLLQQVNAEIARKNLENNEAIYKIAEEKFRLGKVSRNDLLQLQLSLMNAKVAQAQASLDARNASLRLRTYMGYTGDETLELVAPVNIPALLIDENLALAEAHKNRKESVAFKRRVLQAEQEVAYAKGKNGLNANLFATFGLTNQATSFTDSYLRPIDQQRVRVGFDIPIMDWGKQRSTIKTARINQELAQYTVDQDATTFEQAVITQVNQFQMLRERLTLSAQADDIAQERYEITKATYLIGKISITDLNIAALEKDQAKRAYVSSLRDFWMAYYNLRTLTLYDFQNNKPLTIEP